MARPIVLSNGEMHVGINKFGLVHDLYYPYVGLENHVAGRDLRHKVGVWVNGELSWLDADHDWTFTFDYPSRSLIGHTVATNKRLGIMLEFDDFVDAHMSAFMRNIQIVNLRDHDQDIRLFMHQAFIIGDSNSKTDTGQYLPEDSAVMHYRGRRVMIVSGKVEATDLPFDQHTIGLFGIENHEGSYRDADDGELSMGNVEHGRVDSVIRFSVHVPAHNSVRVHYWIAAGTSMREALYIHRQLQSEGLQKRLHTTADWWHEWIKPAETVAEKLPEGRKESFLRSALIVKSQIDKRGAIMASTDSTMLNFSRDAYAYSWPRDGANIVWPLIRMGYVDEPRRFFEFCRRGLHPEGYLMHKYRADGALGSSWHPYVHDGLYARPIQEDETALVLFVFSQFYHANKSDRLLQEFYQSMVVPMADFMAGFIDERTGLPSPSYDLWEEVLLTSTYTTSVTYAALLAAAELAEISEDSDNAVKWRTAAEDIYSAAHKHLYNPERKAFFKGILASRGEIQKNDVVDLSSFFGAFIFGLFPVGSEELSSTFTTITELFGKDGSTRGLPRYEHDNYYREHPSAEPNWWFISSLWLAQYATETHRPEEAEAIIAWVEGNMSSSGILSEQMNPRTGEKVSVEPLTWSHAEYISTLLDTISETP